MSDTLLNAVTDMGDGAILFPLSVALGIGFWIQHSARMALIWLLSLTSCLVLTALLKVIGHACGEAWFAGSLVSPSGHVAFSTAFYGALGVVAANLETKISVRLFYVGILVVLVSGIAGSRVLLHHHTIIEVAVGLCVGGIAVCMFAWGYMKLKVRISMVTISLFAITAASLLIFVHGIHLKAEDIIALVSTRLGISRLVCAQ
jgi:membrane-associated phospholipid phosphatase